MILSKICIAPDESSWARASQTGARPSSRRATRLDRVSVAARLTPSTSESKIHKCTLSQTRLAVKRLPVSRLPRRGKRHYGFAFAFQASGCQYGLWSNSSPTNRSAHHVLIPQEDSPCNMVGLAADQHRGHPRHAGVTPLTPVVSWPYVCLCGHSLALFGTSRRHTVRGRARHESRHTTTRRGYRCA
jgi:hypothetical protein